ncbi:hypothetical protein PHISP_04221 [Aspergillus sp. HF37]|nr:hypothetical protein PHISP_04221 [Aspergillus sp. HF37]
MHLPSPLFSFALPSVHDGSQLDCRLYLPRKLQRPESAPRRPKRGAIVAHPYAPLGGCYDDPVVNFIGAQLLQAGYVVGTFNFRGAGDSEGRTSWTAKPELADYVTFYGFMLLYLYTLQLGAPAHKGDSDSPAGMHLILGGYSYGSLIASHLPATDVVVDLFRQAVSGTAPYEVCKIAEKIAAHSKERLGLQTQSPTADKPTTAIDGDGFDKISGSTVSYLLVSPLLPPLSQLLTVFSKLSLDLGVEIPAQGKQIPCPKPATQLGEHRTLAIYGNQDGFTSAKKLRTWAAGLSERPQSQFQTREIDRAGHFWREDGVAIQARRVLEDWLEEMP